MPPKTVLVVEDDQATRAMYRDALRHAGYHVIAVEDGLDALRRIEQAVPDVVILDLMLPRVGGWDVYGELRANSRTQGVPVVIVTACDPRALEQDALCRFLRKPVSPDSLVLEVGQVIRSERTEAAGG